MRYRIAKICSERRAENRFYLKNSVFIEDFLQFNFFH